MATVENLKIIRLLGEEILGEVVEENTSVVKIKNPVRIVVIPSKSDPKNPSVAFAPFADFSEDKEFEINRSMVISIMNPIKEFVNQYNTTFGGLVVPPSSKIITP